MIVRSIGGNSITTVCNYLLTLKLTRKILYYISVDTTMNKNDNEHENLYYAR